MSTRLGVKREAQVVSASSRTGADGKLYYDIQVPSWGVYACIVLGSYTCFGHGRGWEAVLQYPGTPLGRHMLVLMGHVLGAFWRSQFRHFINF